MEKVIIQFKNGKKFRVVKHVTRVAIFTNEVYIYTFDRRISMLIIRITEISRISIERSNSC